MKNNLILIFLLIVSCSSYEPDKYDYGNNDSGNDYDDNDSGNDSDDDPKYITIYDGNIDIYFSGFHSVDLVGDVLPLESFRILSGENSSTKPYLGKHSSIKGDFITYRQITTTVSEAVKKALHLSPIKGVDIDNTTAYYRAYDGIENAEDQYSTTTVKVYVKLRAYPTCEFDNPSGRDPRTYQFVITLRASVSITGINKVQIPIGGFDRDIYALTAENTGVYRSGWGNIINNIKVESSSDYTMENITIPTHIGSGYAVTNPPPPSMSVSEERRKNATISLIEKAFPYLDVYEIYEIKKPSISSNQKYGIHVFRKGVYEYKARVKSGYILMSDAPAIPSRRITFTMYGLNDD